MRGCNEMTRKAVLLALILLLLPLTLAGCRTRTVADPDQADVVLQSADPAPSEDPPTPSPTPGPTTEPTPTPEPEPFPGPTPTPEAEPPAPEPVASSAPSRPPVAQGLSSSGQTGSGPEDSSGTQPDIPGNTGDARPGGPGDVSQSGNSQLQPETDFDVTVTYDPNGGDTPPVSTVVHTGEPYGVQPEAIRRGYAFAGWWTAPSGGEQVTSDTVVTETETHTLYAHWTEKRASIVTFDGNGGRVKSKEAHLELSDGNLYGELPTPLREGYGFDGWFTAPDGGEPITSETVFSGGDLTLYAHWTYDPYEFWSFTLRNKTQQVYMCQEISVYFELEQDHVTQQNTPLISATGSTNIAANRSDPSVTDDWVLEKNPQVVVKVTGSMGSAAAVKATMAARFPDQDIIVVSSSALNGGPAMLYTQLALAKRLYGDWYTDVDLSVVAAELGIGDSLIYF